MKIDNSSSVAVLIGEWRRRSELPLIVSSAPTNGSSKNETPKNGLGDQALECLFSSQIPDTETKRDPQNSVVPRGFEGSSHVGRWRPDWLAGATGFELPHSASVGTA
jgi:hypothetical protein